MRLHWVLACCTLIGACGSDDGRASSTSGGSTSAGGVSGLGGAAGSAAGGIGGTRGSTACFPAADPSADRIVVVGHPLISGGDGTEIRTLTLTAEGELLDNGMRLDVGAPPARNILVPSGEYLLVLGEEGLLVSVRVNSASDMAVVDSVQLPSADWRDIQLSANGERAYAVGMNVTEEAGLAVVQIACDGTLTHLEDAFFGIRLASSFAWLPGEERAILLGGQAIFDPVDDDDVRLLGKNGEGFDQLGAFDLYGDLIDAARIAVSPDGTTLAIPNGSPLSEEGSQLLIASIADTTITEFQRILGQDDAREALFSSDGDTLLVSRFEPGRVTVLSQSTPGSWSVADEITGVGLANSMAMVRSGPQAGLVLVTSTDAEANIAMLRVTGPGVVANEGQLDLGPGGENLAYGITLLP